MPLKSPYGPFYIVVSVDDGMCEFDNSFIITYGCFFAGRFIVKYMQIHMINMRSFPLLEDVLIDIDKVPSFTGFQTVSIDVIVIEFTATMRLSRSERETTSFVSVHSFFVI